MIKKADVFKLKPPSFILKALLCADLLAFIILFSISFIKDKYGIPIYVTSGLFLAFSIFSLIGTIKTIKKSEIIKNSEAKKALKLAFLPYLVSILELAFFIFFGIASIFAIRNENHTETDLLLPFLDSYRFFFGIYGFCFILTKIFIAAIFNKQNKVEKEIKPITRFRKLISLAIIALAIIQIAIFSVGVVAFCLYTLVNGIISSPFNIIYFLSPALNIIVEISLTLCYFALSFSICFINSYLLKRFKIYSKKHNDERTIVSITAMSYLFFTLFYLELSVILFFSQNNINATSDNYYVIVISTVINVELNLHLYAAIAIYMIALSITQISHGLGLMFLTKRIRRIIENTNLLNNRNTEN